MIVRNGVTRSDEQVIQKLKKLMAMNTREKPSFSDAWLLNSGPGEEIESYNIPNGEVSIRRSLDGQIDYILKPNEYRLPPDEASLLLRMIRSLHKEAPSLEHVDRGYMRERSRSSLIQIGVKDMPIDREDALCEFAVRYTIGYGLLEALIEDPHIEDVFVDAPCYNNRIHVTVNGISGFNSVVRCRSNILLEEVEMEYIVSRLRRNSGLPFSEAQPILECEMGLQATRATVVGRPLSPAGVSLSLRRHSSQPWTLTRMIRNGSLDLDTAAMLSLLVDGRSTMLICGPRGAGKSSLLSACLFEFPLSQRILTLEDTPELPVAAMQSQGYKVQSMVTDGRNGESIKDRTKEILRLSLRMGESALIVGEVRGEEVSSLYEGMRTGRAGSAVMGTIHGESATSVYERVVHDIGVSPEAFMATDVIMTIALTRPRGSQNTQRSGRELVETGPSAGEFRTLSTFSGWEKNLLESRTFKRIASSWSIDTSELMVNLICRRDLKKFLVDVSDVYKEALSAEWTRRANEHLAACMVSGPLDPSEVLESFKQRFYRRSGIE